MSGHSHVYFEILDYTCCCHTTGVWRASNMQRKRLVYLEYCVRGHVTRIATRRNIEANTSR